MKNTIKNESGIKWNGWALNTFTVSLASHSSAGEAKETVKVLSLPIRYNIPHSKPAD